MRKTAHKTIPKFSLERCKRCGICSQFCPGEAIAAQADGTPLLTDPDACTSCRLCEQLCPDFAIEMIPAGSDVPAGPDVPADRKLRRR